MGRRNGRAWTGPTFGEERSNPDQRARINQRNQGIAYLSIIRSVFQGLGPADHTQLAEQLQNQFGRKMLRARKEEVELAAFELSPEWLHGKGVFLSRAAAYHLAKFPLRARRFPKSAVGPIAAPILDKAIRKIVVRTVPKPVLTGRRRRNWPRGKSL